MDVMTAIRTRRSVRSYSDRPIPGDAMQRLLDALRLAPSACNNQPWRFVIVTDAATRKALALASHNQAFIAEAPVVVVGVGYPAAAYPRMGGRDNSAGIDLAIALDHLTLAATAEGLGTCWIGAFAEDEVKRVVNAPREARIIALMPVGYPASPDLLKPAAAARRKPAADVFVRERFA